MTKRKRKKITDKVTPVGGITPAKSRSVSTDDVTRQVITGNQYKYYTTEFMNQDNKTMVTALLVTALLVTTLLVTTLCSWCWCCIPVYHSCRGQDCFSLFKEGSLFYSGIV